MPVCVCMCELCVCELCMCVLCMLALADQKHEFLTVTHLPSRSHRNQGWQSPQLHATLQPLFTCNISIQRSLSIPVAHFPVLILTLIRSRFQANPATLLIPSDLVPFPLWWNFLCGGGVLNSTRYQSGSFSLLHAGSGSSCLRSFSLHTASHTNAFHTISLHSIAN